MSASRNAYPNVGTSATPFTLDSAQAALALGPVEYVCNVCKRTHMSRPLSKSSSPCLICRMHRGFALAYADYDLAKTARLLEKLRDEMRKLDRSDCLEPYTQEVGSIYSLLAIPIDLLKIGYQTMLGVNKSTDSWISSDSLRAAIITESVVSALPHCQAESPDWVLMVPNTDSDAVIALTFCQYLGGGCRPSWRSKLNDKVMRPSFVNLALIAWYEELRLDLDRLAKLGTLW